MNYVKVKGAEDYDALQKHLEAFEAPTSTLSTPLGEPLSIRCRQTLAPVFINFRSSESVAGSNCPAPVVEPHAGDIRVMAVATGCSSCPSLLQPSVLHIPFHTLSRRCETQLPSCAAGSTTKMIKDHCESKTGYTHVIIEKPFGYDSASYEACPCGILKIACAAEWRPPMAGIGQADIGVLP